MTKGKYFDIPGKHLRESTLTNYESGVECYIWNAGEIKDKSRSKSVDFLEICKEQVKNPKGFYVFGDPGLGKTYAMAAMAKELAKGKKTVYFFRKGERFFQAVGETIDHSSDDYPKSKIVSSGIVFIDDLTPDTLRVQRNSSIFTGLVEHRWDEELPLFIASNYPPDVLLGQMTHDVKKQASTSAYAASGSTFINDPIEVKRVIDRLGDIGSVLELEGESYRGKPK